MTLITLMMVKAAGTATVSHSGATGRCVAASAQVLDIKMKYIIGICRQNARYFATRSGGLLSGIFTNAMKYFSGVLKKG